jgi:hypothetical protein
MQNRRKFLLMLTTGIVAMGFVVASVIADELIGVITKVDVEGKKITVEEKGTEKQVELKITDETEQVSQKGTAKVDLEKLAGYLKKVQEEQQKKGITVKVTHDKGVASKIETKRGSGKAKKKVEQTP